MSNISSLIQTNKPIGILGGTFDPIHFGHLRSALELYEHCDLAEVRLIPCGTPPDRPAPQASREARLDMLQLAVADQPGLVVDDREIKRGGISYTIDTLTSLREEVGEQPLCLIIGADRLKTLPDWRHWEQLIALSHLLIMPRPGYVAPTEGPVADLVIEHTINDAALLRHTPAGQIFFSPITQLEIAATDIRDHIKQGRSPRYLLPEPVIHFINKQRLYL